MSPAPTDPLELVLRGYEPTVRPPTLTGGDVAYAVDDLPVGRVLLASRIDGTVVASSYVADDAAAEVVLDRLARRISPRVLRGGRALDGLRRQLDAYFAGRLRRFDIPLDLTLATPFQRDVLQHLAATTGYGARTSYGHLATGLGRPTAARAVGAALGANPLCIVLPCHRVVAGSGALTGYAGGLAAKQFLLDLESTGGGPKDTGDGLGDEGDRPADG